MEQSPSLPLVRRILADYCNRQDLSLVCDEGSGQAGYIELADGRRRFFRGTHFDLNPLGAAEIADDKAYTLSFLGRDGFTVPDSLLVHGFDVLASLRVHKPEIAAKMHAAEDALHFAETVGYPVFVKPNSGQEGEDVVRLNDQADLQRALDELLMRHSSLLVQKAVRGADLRILVLDGEILLALDRQPVQVEGDGEQTVEQLAIGVAGLNFRDPRIEHELTRQGLGPASILEEGQTVELLPNNNLSAGAKAKDITNSLAGDLKQTAVSICGSLGLRYAGIDLIAENPEKPGSRYAVLEVNAAPGLNRYAAQGAEELAKVTSVYERVLDALTNWGPQ
ncbi:ATP-grasp domain-containing protein [Roseibium alexandrii]|uniref:Cyanophycin synthetase n=1 Tax=Roseibium alexandrii TaxID=388408 RepID=A0A0M7AH91_9HYPH|nr:ATP-grasp domain-containing protein [Roseibium alexandrii]CTQ73951.1 Cyanophycin synthetase [Roseibium alexandrii]